MTRSNDGSVVEFISPFNFQVTMDRLSTAILGAGMKLFATIDHAANAREVGLDMPPTVVMIYGKAEGGTPMMLAAPRAALDLPLHVLLREDTDGRTIVALRPIAPTLEASGVPAALASRLEPAQQLLLNAFEP